MIDPQAAKVCNATARVNTTNALACLRAAKNKDVQNSAAKVCTTIASINSSKVSSCMTAIANSTFTKRATEVCDTTARINTTNAVSCLNSAKNKQLQNHAMNVCGVIATINTSKVSSCIDAIANKSVNRKAAQICEKTARSNTSSGVQCLRNSAVGSVPPAIDIDIDLGGGSISIDLGDGDISVSSGKYISQGMEDRTLNLVSSINDVVRDYEYSMSSYSFGQVLSPLALEARELRKAVRRNGLKSDVRRALRSVRSALQMAIEENEDLVGNYQLEQDLLRLKKRTKRLLNKLSGSTPSRPAINTAFTNAVVILDSDIQSYSDAYSAQLSHGEYQRIVAPVAAYSRTMVKRMKLRVDFITMRNTLVHMTKLLKTAIARADQGYKLDGIVQIFSLQLRTTKKLIRMMDNHGTMNGLY
jgi:hypothetical protein